MTDGIVLLDHHYGYYDDTKSEYPEIIQHSFDVKLIDIVPYKSK